MSVVITNTINNWLQRLLQKDSLDNPTGKPLFQYHISEGEYFELARLLRGSDFSSQIKDSKIWCAAFCFFCSEWYRRDYDGTWSWDGIHRALGFSVDANDRGGIVENGLVKYWKRPISCLESDRKSLLGSLFREGGLPFSLLKTEGSKFQRIFKEILRSLDDVKAMGDSPVELVKYKLETFPEALKQDTTADLIVSMAEQLLVLIDAYKLSGAENPAEKLDADRPGWRSAFPIPMDGEESNDFLAGLLASASKQRLREVKRKRLSCEQRIANTDELGFVAKVKVDNIIKINVEPKCFSSARVEVFVYEGSKPIVELGVGHVKASESKVDLILRNTVREFRRNNPDRSLYFCVLQNGQEIYKEAFSGSEIPIGDIPAVFRKKDEGYFLTGVGSCSFKAETLRVITPDVSELNIQNGAIFSESTEGNLKTIDFCGDLVVSISEDEDRYRISSRLTSILADQVKVSGAQLPYSSTTGNPIYLGVPHIHLDDTNYQTWVGGKQLGAGEDSASYGRQTVKVKSRDGTTLYHRRFDILPPDFSIVLEASKTPNRGTIHIGTTRNHVISCDTQGVEVISVKIERGKRLELFCEGFPPSEISLKLRPNLLAEPIYLALPFPSVGVLAFDADGGELPTRLAFDQLLGVRMQLFPKFKNARAIYHIDLIGPPSVPGASFNFTYKVLDKPLEISLYEFRHHVQSLLAASGDLDDIIRLRVSGDCRQTQYNIGRYTVETETTESGTGIQINGINNDKAKPQLMRLSDPAATPKPLIQRLSQCVGTGRFDFLDKMDEPGLIVPAKGSAVMFRSRFVSSNKELLYEPAKSLQKAATCFHPIENPGAFVPVLGDMTKDWVHSGWTFLSTLLDKYGYLPLSTFEIWSQVVNHPDVLAVVVIRMHQGGELLTRLQQEFNVMWELIPISSWQGALKLLRQHGVANDFDEELIEYRVKRKLKVLEQAVPYFNWLNEDEQSKAKEMPLSVLCNIMPAIITDWQQELLIAHAEDDRWPTYFSSALKRWLVNQKIEWLTPPSKHDYQNSVSIFPIFAAAIVAEKAHYSDIVFEPGRQDMFQIRQLLDYDRHWFESVFKMALTVFSK